MCVRAYSPLRNLEWKDVDRFIDFKYLRTILLGIFMFYVTLRFGLDNLEPQMLTEQSNELC